jgi:hypothetical protein
LLGDCLGCEFQEKVAHYVVRVWSF